MFQGTIAIAVALSGVTGQVQQDDIERRLSEAQAHRKLCGPICLWYCLRQHGIDLPLSDVTQKAALTPYGMPFNDLVALSKRLGLAAHAVQFEPSEIASLPTPSIVVVNDSHCIVYLGQDRDVGTHMIFEPVTGVVGPEDDAVLRRAASGVAISFEAAAPRPATVCALIFLAAAQVLVAVSLVSHIARRRRAPERANRGAPSGPSIV